MGFHLVGLKRAPLASLLKSVLDYYPEFRDFMVRVFGILAPAMHSNFDKKLREEK